MWNPIRYAQSPVWTNMTNAYPFLPITPKSMLIVLFDNNGPDLNLLDPFHFKFHCCALKAESQTCITMLFLTSLVPSAAQSVWVKAKVLSWNCQGMAVWLCVEAVSGPGKRWNVYESKNGLYHAFFLVFLTFWNQTQAGFAFDKQGNEKS